MLLEIHKVNGVANEKADEAKRSGNHPWNFTSYHGKCDVLLVCTYLVGYFNAKTLMNIMTIYLNWVNQKQLTIWGLYIVESHIRFFNLFFLGYFQ